MLAVMSGIRGDDEHVRALLDQRAQRADVPPPHTRFSIFSDRSDSPSLYSHFDNNYRNTPTTPVPHFPRFHDNNAYDDRHELYLPPSPKERLADPNASSLDLSEDTDAYSESGSRINDPEDDSNLNPDSDEDPETRLSLMGPKMRVHSRAPWEEDEGSLSDEDLDDGGNDNASVFSGKKSGRAVMRGFGFGAKSPAPRPSFDSSCPTKSKRSFETASSVAVSSTSRSAIHALAQASISSTSLAVGPSPSTSRLPHKLSMGRLALNRDRSASGATSTSDTNSNYPPLPSPRSAAYTERPSGREARSPYGRRDSISPNQLELAASVARTRSPSPIPLPDRDGAYMHPYANPALLSAYHGGPIGNPFSKDGPDVGSGHARIARNDSVATLAASEETVMLTHPSSTASLTSTSGLESTTPPTSDFSLVSSASRTELPRAENHAHEAEKARQQKRSRRETKLGPISAPSMVGNNDFTAATPYNLISLEQAQARIKERNRSATTGAVPFPGGSFDERGGHNDVSSRARSSSANSKAKHPLPLLTIDNNKMDAYDIPTPISPVSSKQLSPTSAPAGKVLRPKRSGFMKLFNGRDKDKITDVPPPPVPSIADMRVSPQSSDHSHPPSTARPSKMSAHRVPVPVMPSSPNFSENKDDSRSKKSGPSLSIKVSSPPTSHISGQESLTRRSDSPKSLHPTMSPKMPSSAPADMTQFPALRLRPVSSFFSSNFAEHLLTEDRSPGSPKNTDVSSLISPTTIASSDLIPSPVNAGFNVGNISDSSHGQGGDRFSTAMGGEDEDPSAIIAALKEQIRTSRKTWQRQIWELEGQVRDLRAEIDDMRAGDVCEACGRGGSRTSERNNSNAGVIHRPRAKTGYGARFASGNEG